MLISFRLSGQIPHHSTTRQDGATKLAMAGCPSLANNPVVTSISRNSEVLRADRIYQLVEMLGC
jgi:hypothetical protein